MTLNWIVGKRREDVHTLISRGKYARALEILEAQLAQDSSNFHLRQAVADAMVLSGRKDDAVQVLLRLSDDLAKAGFVAKAIAILKKIDRFAPGREDVYQKLANELPDKRTGKRRQAPGGQARPADPEPPAPPSAAAGDLAERIIFEDYVGRELESSRQSILEGRDRLAKLVPKTLTTPLFESFTSEELLLLLPLMRLSTYESGDIIVAEGSPGESLYILTSGRVKAFVRNAAGHIGKVRELTDGDFFGEISFLKSKPRTATITAASRCEILILDKVTLLEICKTHPRAKMVLERFSAIRENSPKELFVRKSVLSP